MISSVSGIKGLKIGSTNRLEISAVKAGRKNSGNTKRAHRKIAAPLMIPKASVRGR